MEELLEDLVVTKDYGLRFAAEEPKVNQSDLCHGYFVIHRLLVLLAILIMVIMADKRMHLKRICSQFFLFLIRWLDSVPNIK